MSVDNVDNIESNDNALDSCDDIVDNTHESVDDCHDSNLYDNVAGQNNKVSVWNNCLDYDFDENLEDHTKNDDSNKENITNHVNNIPKVSFCNIKRAQLFYALFNLQTYSPGPHTTYQG